MEMYERESIMNSTMNEWESVCDKCAWIHQEEEKCGE
jgi:hypothetical protein